MSRLGPIAVCLLLASACKAHDAGEPQAALTIFAASSLTDAFDELADEFVEHTGGDRPVLAFAGSQVLRLQLSEGARADVFASADSSHIDSLVVSSRVFDPTVFAQNELVVIVPRTNPASLERFTDLTRARRIVVGAPSVPIGAYTGQMLERAELELGPRFTERVRDRIVSRESNARLVRAKVELGEADAAIVYRSDVSRAVRTIEIPPELQVRARYYIGFVGTPPPSDAAKRWVAFVASPPGRAVLAKHGFSTP